MLQERDKTAQGSDLSRVEMDELARGPYRARQTSYCESAKLEVVELGEVVSRPEVGNAMKQKRSSLLRIKEEVCGRSSRLIRCGKRR